MAEEKQEQTFDELVEKGRTEYGIVNADQMSRKQLEAEIKAIDDQKATAENDEPEQDNEDTSDSTEEENTAEGNGDEDESATEDFSKLTRSELEAKAEELGVEDPSDKQNYPNKADLLVAVESKQTS